MDPDLEPGSGLENWIRAWKLIQAWKLGPGARLLKRHWYFPMALQFLTSGTFYQSQFTLFPVMTSCFRELFTRAVPGFPSASTTQGLSTAI